MTQIKKKVHKAKSKFAIIFFLLPTFFVLYADISFCFAEIKAGLDGTQMDWSVLWVEFFILFSFTGVILFWLLNMCPAVIEECDDEFKFVYLCRNCIRVKKENISILQKDIDVDGWYAVLFVRGRFTYISNGEFPKLRHLIE